MAVYSFRVTLIGIAATPTAELMLVNTARGTSLAKLDLADNSVQTTQTSTNSQNCGWQNNAGFFRNTPVSWLPIPTRIKRGSRCISCNLKLYIIASTWPSNLVPTDGSNIVEVWAVRRTMSGSGSTITGLTWVNAFTATPWDELGIKYGVGNDTDATYLGSFTWSQADHDAAPATTPVVKTIPMRAEMQRLLSFDESIQLAFRHKWPNVSADSYIRLNQPSSTGATPHSYFELGYRQPLEFYYTTADHKVDQSRMLDVNSSGIDQHLFAGTPAVGATGTVMYFAIRNESDSAQPASMVLAGKSLVGSTDHTGVVGSGRLRYPRVYDFSNGVALTPQGRWRLVFTAATTYDVKFTPEGGTESTITTGKSTASNEVIQVTALNALSLLSAAWSGTFANLDVVAFETYSDLHTVATPLSNLDLYRLAPHGVNDRSTGQTTLPRVASRMVACQLYRHDTAVIANSGGATGVIATVTDGANSGTHIKVPDTSIFTANDYGTLATYTASDDTVGVARVEQVQIKTVYAMNDATYPGQLLFFSTVATPADFDGNSIFTTGVWTGRLDVADQGFLASSASISSDTLTLDTPPTRTTGVVTLLDPVSGNSQQMTILSYPGGNQLRMTAAPSYAYPVGTIVYFGDETKSNVPFALWGQPPVSTTRGRKQAFVRGASWIIT